MAEFSHFDAMGGARMVDVSPKAESERSATAEGRVTMQPATLERILTGGVAKGDVLQVARLAGIMAAKRTSELIPLCHPLALTAIALELTPDASASAVVIRATVKLVGRTGVEKEALTAVAVAALTVYDMCKSADRGMRIEAIRLLAKEGGKSGSYRAE
jgi:cyclic pyranopterin phosphate synthase